MDRDVRKKTELANLILLDQSSKLDDEELLHLLLEQTFSKDPVRENETSFGARMADRIARFAGSWRFILIFIGCLLAWIFFNAAVLINRGFDPYPFILLNLVLSCVAAVQAPVIMMSQNRQEEKDRMRARNDYKVNLKSEIIVEDLHGKLDTLLENQRRIMERLGALEKKEKKSSGE